MLESLAILVMALVVPMMLVKVIGGGGGSGGGGMVGGSMTMLFQLGSQITMWLFRLVWAVCVFVGEAAVGIVSWSSAQLVHYGSMALRRAAARSDESEPPRPPR